MNKNELNFKLNYEKDNNYPAFRNEIKDRLINVYRIREYYAEYLINDKQFIQEITDDISWSQHMGIDYWCKLIHTDYIEKYIIKNKEMEKMNKFNSGIIFGELAKQDVELTSEERMDVQTLLSELEYNEDSLKTIQMLLEKVSDSNYKLGIKRQKDALLSNIKDYINTL